MITEEQLKSAGYRKWYTTGAIDVYSDFFYQKPFKDDDGIKYHIELRHYPSTDRIPECWMAVLNNNEPHVTFQIHRPESLEDVEHRMETVWRSQGSYYEKY